MLFIFRIFIFIFISLQSFADEYSSCTHFNINAKNDKPSDLKTDCEPFDSNILPEENIVYEHIADHAEFLIVLRSNTGQRYKIRPGIGCLRALLDPPENIRLNLIGLGNFTTDSKTRDFPYLHIETPYHKVSCKVISVENYIKPNF